MFIKTRLKLYNAAHSIYLYCICNIDLHPRDIFYQCIVRKNGRFNRFKYPFITEYCVLKSISWGKSHSVDRYLLSIEKSGFSE